VGRFYHGAVESVKGASESENESGALMFDSVEAFLQNVEGLIRNYSMIVPLPVF